MYLNYIKCEMDKIVKETQCLKQTIEILKNTYGKCPNIQLRKSIHSLEEEIDKKIKKYEDNKNILDTIKNLPDRENKIKIMFYVSDKNELSTSVWITLFNEVRNFQTIPYIKKVDTEGLHEIILFLSEDLSYEEVQTIWNNINYDMYYEPKDFVKNGSLVYWNGKEISQE